MSTTIVQATVADAQTVAPLFNAYRVFYEQESDLPLAEAFLTARLTQEQSVIFFAQNNNGDVLGFTQLYPTFSSISAQNSWILNDLFVTQAARGQGIGRQLLDKARSFAEATFAEGITLETAIDNHTAQSLYESSGYQRETAFYTYHLSLEDVTV